MTAAHGIYRQPNNANLLIFENRAAFGRAVDELHIFQSIVAQCHASKVATFEPATDDGCSQYIDAEKAAIVECAIGNADLVHHCFRKADIGKASIRKFCQHQFSAIEIDKFLE